MPESERRRLNSWKEISGYVGRDVRTVSRWEKHRGLPVYRLPGGGRSVFAYSDEIDTWLTGGGADDGASDRPAYGPDQAAGTAPVASSGQPRRRRAVSLAAAAAAVLVAIAIWSPRTWSSAGSATSVDLQGTALVARAPDSAEVWRYEFDGTVRWPPVDARFATPDLDGNGHNDVVAVVGALTPSGIDDELLYAFDDRGRLKWQHRLTDVVRFRDRAYEPPWSSGPMTALRMDGHWRVVWMTHHHTWWPSIVAMFAADGRQMGSFVHAGWLTSLAAGPDGKVVVTGVANHADADVIAVLDAKSWPGSSPQPAGTEFECVGCAAGRPFRYYLLPRSELNVRPDMYRVPAKIHVFDAGIEVRVAQSEEVQPAETIYELTPDYRLHRIRPSDANAASHRRLEETGALKHRYVDCPERMGFLIREWDRDSGWSERRIGSARSGG